VVSVSSEVNRPSLNLRVDSSIKQRFEDTIHDKYGDTSPYASVELERELRYFLRDGDLDDLHKAIDEVEEALGIQSSKKNYSTGTHSRSDTEVVGYHVHEEVQHRIRANNEDYRNSGELVESVMAHYIQHDSALCRLTNRIQRLSKQIDSQEPEDDEPSAQQRRTKSIIDALGDSTRLFNLDEFKQALSRADNVDKSKYNLETYLPRVIDELNLTWHPKNRKSFIPEDSTEPVIPDHRDPTKMPGILMDEDDKLLAIKIDALRKAIHDNKEIYSTGDAKRMLNKRTTKSQIDWLMQKIDENSPGYNYNSEKQKMRVAKEKIEDESRVANLKTLRRIGNSIDDS
jgi:hypothetical protein